MPIDNINLDELSIAELDDLLKKARQAKKAAKNQKKISVSDNEFNVWRKYAEIAVGELLLRYKKLLDWGGTDAQKQEFRRICNKVAEANIEVLANDIVIPTRGIKKSG